MRNSDLIKELILRQDFAWNDILSGLRSKRRQAGRTVNLPFTLLV